MNILLSFIISLLFLELGLFFLIHYLRNDYQWLITEKDEHPLIRKESLTKFIEHGFDPELGWCRKPNTKGREKGRDGDIEYHINNRGSRENPGYEEAKAIISCYGDSFAFARQVNDYETWEHYLSKLTNSNVLNFGVGNYGLDQSLLRLKKEYVKNRTKIVIMAVVPETISRILNVWKHYHEYGNIFGFKPRFKINNGDLVFVKNIIDDEAKFYRLKDYLISLQENDYFYENKFKKDILKFPYLYSLIKTGRRNIPLISRLILNKIYGFTGNSENYKEHLHNISVLKRNINICAELFKKKEIEDLLVRIIDDFISYSASEKFSPVFVMLPQLNDIIFIKSRGSYYVSFINRIESKLTTIDLTASLVSDGNVEKMYSNDHYGGHLSKTGNEFVANAIYRNLREKILL